MVAICNLAKSSRWGLSFYTFTNSKMQLLTSDLWILENCFDFLSDLPDGFIVTWKNTRKIEKIRDKLQKRCKKQFDKKMQKIMQN